MQIWKSTYMFVFIEKYSPENFTFLILGILELYKRKVCEKFVHKHMETIESVKISLLFKKNTNWITREFLWLKMRNFQGIIFI